MEGLFSVDRGLHILKIEFDSKYIGDDRKNTSMRMNIIISLGEERSQICKNLICNDYILAAIKYVIIVYVQRLRNVKDKEGKKK